MAKRKQEQGFETISRTGDRTPMASGHRLRLKAQPDLEEIKEKIGEIADKRFYNLKKRIIADLDSAGFRDIDVGLYIRLGVWSHIGASYRKTAEEVKAVCKAMFGYSIPAKIGTVVLREYRYKAVSGKTWKMINGHHDKKIAELTPMKQN